MKVRMLTEVDLAAISVYCQSYGRWVEAEKLVKAKGLTTTTDKGNVIQRPEVGIANTAMRDIISFAKEFGMTPSSRSNIKVDDTLDKEDSFLTFIKGGKSG
jgi:P27 family predicted phage terminase small subunit